ncbi:MAG: pitrilysin family protein [Candidatus Neomarinimicrobiota bacterium]
MVRRIPFQNVLFLGYVGLLFLQTASAQSLKAFEKNVTEFTLDNGLNFIVVERHEAPVVSLFTYADVGSVDEIKGITGIAHIFEHMAFKGTRNIGTDDYESEKAVMDRMDRLFLEMKKERRKGNQVNEGRLEGLEEQFEKAQQEAQEYLVHDEFEEAIDRQGGVGLNATTGPDATRYFYSLPSNKLELWMSLESDRFLNPVLREFYKEKDVVMEERRLGENNPIGRLVEDFLATAYKAHPYGEPVVGHMSDLKTITREEGEAWFAKYYGANNLTIAIVGDVKPREVEEMADTYFGRLRKGEKPEPVETVEPEQQGERRCTVVAQAQPLIIIGYHRPDINHPDNAAFDAITDMMGRGRTSRLYKRLVKEKKIAISVGAFTGLTGDKYPGLFIFYAFPAKDQTNEESEETLYDEIEKMKTELVTAEELEKAKTRARADLIRQLNSNFGLAYQLTFYEVVTGGWRNLFRQLERIEKLTEEDIRRVAKEYFDRKNKTVGTLVTEEVGT